jgi:hypothetical protein
MPRHMEQRISKVAREEHEFTKVNSSELHQISQ